MYNFEHDCPSPPPVAGEASVSALLKFVPAQLPVSPQFRGLHVDLVVRSVNISTLMPVGAPLTHVALGSTVHVLVQVTSLDSVSKSTVRALMPGGLEPIDGNLDDDGESMATTAAVFVTTGKVQQGESSCTDNERR